MFFSNEYWPQLLAPLEILMNKLYLIVPFIFTFLAHQGNREHEIVQPWLPVPQDYKYQEHKGQIPLIIHHKEWNLEYSSDVQNKIVELHKIESGCKKS